MKKNLATFISTKIFVNRKYIPLFTTATLFFVTYVIGATFFEGMREPQIFLNMFRNFPYLLIAEVAVHGDVKGLYIMLSVESGKQRLFANYCLDITGK